MRILLYDITVNLEVCGINMRYSEFSEAFDRQELGRVTSQTPTAYARVLDLAPDREIAFVADRKGSAWQIGFQDQNPQNADGKTSRVQGVQVTSRQDLTGRGDSQRVMSFVKNSMEDFVRSYRPDRMVFTADLSQGSRADLYQKMIQRYLPQDYRVNTVDGSQGSRSLRQFEIVHKNYRMAQGLARGGDDVNMYPTGAPGKPTSAFQDQQYRKDLARALQQHPGDPNLEKELARFTQ